MKPRIYDSTLIKKHSSEKNRTPVDEGTKAPETPLPQTGSPMLVKDAALFSVSERRTRVCPLSNHANDLLKISTCMI